MKSIIRILTLSLFATAAVLSTGCKKDAFQEMTEIPLTRCLQPTELKANVSSVTGNTVQLKWNTSPSVEKYTVVIATDKQFSAIARQESVAPENVPVSLVLDPDCTYYLKIQGTSSKKEASKWAYYSDDSGELKSIKTFAVKDPLYPHVTDRTAGSIALAWSTSIADFKEVTHVEYCKTGGTASKTQQLQSSDIDSGTVTVTGLEPSVEYDIKLMYLSASRGEIVAWTTPDITGTTEVSDLAALKNAIKTSGAKILLKQAGSPYELDVCDISNGFSILGEETADGTKPVIKGEFHFSDTWVAGESVYFEGVEFNGNDSQYGFPIQKKNGGSSANAEIGSIIYKNCILTGYSKGLIYEWGKTMTIGELTWRDCIISNINKDGTQGGDVVDIRNTTSISKLNIVNNTIYQGMRTFVRFDSSEQIGDVKFENNTLQNLCFVDNTNNAGIFGFQKKPASLSFKKNLFLNFTAKSVLGSENAKYLTADGVGLSASDNWFYNVHEGFFTASYPSSKAGYNALDSDPCYNAKGGVFNILASSEISGKEIGASRWWSAYSKEPEDLTLNVLENAKTWNLADAKLFAGTAKEPMVRGDLMIVASQDLPVAMDGSLAFAAGAALTKKGVPQDGYLRFKVNGNGSVVLKPVGENTNAHFTVATCPVVEGSDKPKSASVKGGASPMSCTDGAQKIVISDITGPTMVLVYPSGPVALEKIAWSRDSSAVNTALPAPAGLKAAPESQKSGEGKDVVISWEPVQNAAGYSVVFNGKTYDVEEGLMEYTVEGKTTKMLDAGAYTVSVFALPASDDIYNTMSEAGKVSFAVVPDGGGGSTETVVKSVEELTNAIAAGKVEITLAYNSAAYELGTLALTAPLKLKGQASGTNYPTIKGNVTLSGIEGNVIFTNINFEGTGVSEAVIKEVAAVTADTVAIKGGVIRNYTKALYDNSGKYASAVQNLIFDGIQVYDCSDGADFIDMRNGAYHNVNVLRSTFARSARTFIRTDAGTEINNLTVRNNTFYKVCTNSTSKDNNGLFHVRGTAGLGMQQFKIMNNLFYSILIDTAPGNANGYPKFISKNAAAIKPASIVNNYFWNIQETGDYSWWTVNCTKEEGTAAGGCVLVADPCKDAANSDFTLTNAVAMNSNIGDPRWNPAGGKTPTSQITVDNATDMLTAISAGKTAITLKAGTYDLTAETSVTGGVLEVNTDLNLIGEGTVNFVGGFKFVGTSVSKFSATGIEFSGASTIGNFIEIADATVKMSSVSVKNGAVSNFKNRIYSQSAEASVSSIVFEKITSLGMGTGGDCIDIRKGTASSIKVLNSTFANGIRTFLRIDAAAVCGAVTVKNNTFYNMCAVDSKDNNGIMHIRSSSLAANPSACKVESNIFASMHRASATPAQANGYPKIISTASQAIFEPVFKHNYYYDIDAGTSYNWWNTLTGGQTGGCAGYGVMLTDSPFLDAASGDFTLVNALAISENVGDQRWNPGRGGKPSDPFEVASVEDMLNAIAAGKTSILLAYGTYDFTTTVNEAISSGVLTVSSTLELQGKAKNGLYPELTGAFKLSGSGVKFSLSHLSLSGNSTLGNMIDLDAAAVITSLTLRKCNVAAYNNRLISQSGASTTGMIDISGLYVQNMGTSGDFIDIRKGTASVVKVTNSTFSNGIRTFLRMDAAVSCGSVEVKNNTFYNLCSVDSKDNNGIMHVRSSSLTPATIKLEKNIFASMHRASATPALANGFPKLVSTASQSINEPTFRANLYYDIETGASYSWWNTLSSGETTGTADGGAVLTETPFSADPATGKFTVKSAYKGYGDLRW